MGNYSSRTVVENYYYRRKEDVKHGRGTRVLAAIPVETQLSWDSINELEWDRQKL